MGPLMLPFLVCKISQLLVYCSTNSTKSSIFLVTGHGLPFIFTHYPSSLNLNHPHGEETSRDGYTTNSTFAHIITHQDSTKIPPIRVPPLISDIFTWLPGSVWTSTRAQAPFSKHYRKISTLTWNDCGLSKSTRNNMQGDKAIFTKQTDIPNY